MNDNNEVLEGSTTKGGIQVLSQLLPLLITLLIQLAFSRTLDLLLLRSTDCHFNFLIFVSQDTEEVSRSSFCSGEKNIRPKKASGFFFLATEIS